MAVGKAAALATAIFGAAMFGAGVRTTQNASQPAELAAPAPDPISRPELIKELKPLLKDQSETTGLAAGFGTAEDFAATVHAARNLKIPFDELKREVVRNGRSLADAIRQLKPAVDAQLEADLAKSEALSDLAAIQ